MSAGGDFNGYQLVYSKDADSFSVGQTRVENKPCYHPYQVSVKQGTMHYPLEYDRFDGCIADEMTQLVNDSRYQTLGLDVSEHQVQNESGVLDILLGPPLTW